MIIYRELEQGTDDWLRARCGIPTASNFDQIITPTGKPSSSADRFMNTLLAEWVTGLPGGMEPTTWMQRGTELEPEARAFYELDRDADVEQVGFITRDDGMIGCSPDGLVDDSGMVELKVPSPGVHVEYLLSQQLPGKYRPQVQGQLLIAEREWVDFMSYSPDMPPVIVRVNRDEAFIQSLSSFLSAFVDKITDKREKLRQKGIEPATKEAA